jgi:hypothetical protein
MACLLENEPASDRLWLLAKGVTPEAGAKASLKRARAGNRPVSQAVDPKPGELSMARLKRG